MSAVKAAKYNKLSDRLSELDKEALESIMNWASRSGLEDLKLSQINSLLEVTKDHIRSAGSYGFKIGSDELETPISRSKAASSARIALF